MKTITSKYPLTDHIDTYITADLNIPDGEYTPIFLRKLRPVALPELGSNYDDLRNWVRATVRANIKKAMKKSDSTKKNYHRLSSKLDLKRGPDGILPIEKFSNNQNTFYAQRAAIIYFATKNAHNALSDMDRFDKMMSEAKKSGDSKKMNWAKNKKEQQWHLIIRAANDLVMHPAGKSGTGLIAQNDFRHNLKHYKMEPAVVRNSLLEKPRKPELGAWSSAVISKIITPNKINNSKRKTTNQLYKLIPNWRDIALDHVAEPWKLYTAVASLTGCRPEEINGIEIEIRKQSNGKNIGSEPWITFRIKGVKTNNGHGQKMRVLHIQELNNNAFNYLVDKLKCGSMIVDAPVNHGKPLKDPSSAFRMALLLAGQKFIPNSKLKLSPYCFRHAFACDLKANEYSPQLIGVALSHCSTKTQSAYGRRNDGVKGRRQLEIDGELNIKHDESSRHGRRELLKNVYRPDPVDIKLPDSFDTPSVQVSYAPDDYSDHS